MELKVDGGIVNFATHRINCNVAALAEKIGKSGVIWNVTSYGMLVFGEQDKSRKESFLITNSIPFTTIAISPTQDQVNEVNTNITGKVASRAQALRMLAASSAGVANLESESTY